MPSNRYWIGVDNNWNNTANWSNIHGGTGGYSVPVTGDSAWVDYGVNSIDGYDASAVTLALLVIGRGMGYPYGSVLPVSGLRIGSADGTPLKINATTLRIDNDVIENYFIYGTFTNVYKDKVGPFSKLYLQGAGCTNFEGDMNGQVSFAANCGVDSIDTSGQVFLDTYATTPPALKLHCSKGARVESKRTITGGSIGGKLIMKDAAVQASVNQVEKITMDVASTGGNLKLTIQKPDGTFATTANIAWNATDATYLAAINSALDTSSGVVGGIVATATSGVDPDSGFTLTYSGTGYAGLAWSRASVAQFPTSSTAATYTSVRAAGSELVIEDGGMVQYDATAAIGQTSSDKIRVKRGGVFDASGVKAAISLNSQIIAQKGGKYLLSSTITQATAPRQPGGVEVG